VDINIDLFSGKINFDDIEVASPYLDISRLRNTIFRKATIVCSILEERNHKTYFRFEKNLSIFSCSVDAFVVEYKKNNCNACFIHLSPINKEEMRTFFEAAVNDIKHKSILYNSFQNIEEYKFPWGKIGLHLDVHYNAISISISFN
jgi:hypothetical protein